MKRMASVLAALAVAMIALQGCSIGGAVGQARATGEMTTDRATAPATVTVTVTTTVTGSVGDPGSAGPAGDTGTGGPGSITTPPGRPGCTDIVHADPWIAFESALADGDVLTVGKRGWIRATSLGEVAVQGTPGAVRLSEQSSPTVIRCGTITSTVSWIEVAARAPGAVTLLVSSGASVAKKLHITVSDS